MATRATDTLRWLAGEWRKLYPSAVLSGIVGDTAHARRGGYHISIEDQPASNYSVTRPDDKAPPGGWARDAAAAVDMNLSLADMKLCHGRLRAVWKNRATDPRARYINAHNGWDGNDSAGRYDWYSGAVSSATDDHKWHIHLEIRRRYVNDRAAAAAVLSILRGDSLADFLGDDMAMSHADKVAWATTNRAAALLAGTDAKYQIEGEREPRVETNQVALSLARIEAQLVALSGRDFTDEPAIVAGVLAGLSPEAIAAAIPTTLARQVADELARRLTAPAS